MTKRFLIAALLAVSSGPALAHNPPFRYQRPASTEQGPLATAKKTDATGAPTKAESSGITKKSDATALRCTCHG